jgi:multiple sugar transport system permease protein
MAAMLFLLPNLIGFLCFTAGPVLLSLYMSFTNWSLKPSVDLQWVGLRNYVDLFTDNDFWFYLYNTFYFMIGIPFAVAGSLFLANLLVDSMYLRRNKLRITLATLTLVVGFATCAYLFVSGSKDTALILGVLYLAAACGIFWGSLSYRTMLYVPSFASGVATIILWQQVFNPYHGLANNILGSFLDTAGIQAALPSWLQSTKNLLGFLPLPKHFSNGGVGFGAREAIMIMGFWMGIGGNNMILYIASIANIPESYYEAAEIDGANSFAKFWHITVPSVAPTTFFIAIMATIGGLQGGFQFAKIMTNGGPAGTTTTLAYYIYTAGFGELKLGYASAVAWALFTIVFALTLVNWKYGNRRIE